MARDDKVQAVEEMKGDLQGNNIAIATQYQGISVAEVTELRAKLRDQNIKFKVYKNTLARRALEDLGFGDAVTFMEGPTAWAFSDDPVAPAKALKEFAKEVEVIAMRGGILEGKTISIEQLDALADLPSREQLLTQLAGTLAMPIRNFAGVLSAVPRNFANVLEQVRKKKEEEAA